MSWNADILKSFGIAIAVLHKLQVRIDSAKIL